MSQDRRSATGGLLDKVAGKAKEAVGDLTGNDDLVEEGELQHAKGATEAEARRLEAEAEQAEEVAELTGAKQENRIAQERVQADLARDAQEQRAELQRKAEEERVEREAAQREVAIEQQAEVEHARLDREERDVAVDHGEAVVDAARAEREAAEAEAAAEALDAAQENIEQTRG